MATRKQVQAAIRRRLGRDDFLIRTAMKRSNCRRCGAEILQGYVSGTPTRLDPSPINAEGELVALLGGLHTYSINDSSFRYPMRAWWRHDYEIRKGIPADRYVYASHRCGFTWPPALRDTKPDPRAAMYPPTPDECPF